MKLKKFVTLLILGAMALSLAACGEEPAASESPSQTAAVSSSTEGVTAHYPVTIQNYNYAKEPIDLVFEKTPERVLVLNQNNIETMLALGLEDRIVAAAGLDHEVKEEYKEAFSKIHYLTDFTVDRESVLMLEPDMILGWWSTFGEKRLDGTEFWQDRGIKTYMAENSNSIVTNRTLQNEYDYILDLGKIFDVEDKAQAIVTSIQTEVNGILEKTKGQKQKTALIIEFLGDQIHTYDATTLGGNMVTTLGGNLLEAEATVGLEDLIKLNPDVSYVVYRDGGVEGMAEKSADMVLKNEALASLNAVKNQSVIAIPLGDMYTSAMRTVDGIRIFAQGLYPDLYAEE